MGEIAEMMLDGTLCACCGEYLGCDEGYPIYCASCAPHFVEDDAENAKRHRARHGQKARCPRCDKTLKSKAGLRQHLRDKHGER